MTNDHTSMELPLAMILSIGGILVFGIGIQGSFATVQQRYIVILTAGFLGLLSIVLWIRWERLAFGCDSDD